MAEGKSVSDAVLGLVNAQYEIDSWDHDFTPAPYHLYSEARDALELVPPADRHLVTAELDSRSADTRREAANACRHWRLTSAVDALTAKLDDPDEKVRDACAEALVAITRETALGLLADRGAKISKSVLRHAVAAAYDALGAAVMPFLERLDLPPDASDSEDVWSKLYQADPEAAGAVLARLVTRGTFGWVNGTATLLRRHGGGAWVRPTFLPLLEHRDTSISRVAADVLGQFGDASSLDALFATAQSATHPWQRGAALRSILTVGRQTRTPVIARVQPLLPPDEATQVMLMDTLATWTDVRWEPKPILEKLVQVALHHREEKVVAAALTAARALELESLVADVTSTLTHRRWYDNQLGAARAAYFTWLAEPTLATHVAALERGLASSDAHELELATRVTWELMKAPGGRAHSALMVRAVSSGHRELREAAAACLAEFGVAEANDQLLARAKSGPPEEGSAMLKALARLGDRRALDVALSRCSSVLAGAPIPNDAPSAWLAASAIDVFQRFIDDPRALDALRTSLGHVEMRMRRDAATALGRARDPRAIALLEPLVNDKDKQVRTAATSALTALRAPKETP